jgi:ABC-2 type transport system permease protein
LSILRFSQHWQATEIFRAAPIAGPAALLRGARRAVLVVLTLPLLLLLGGVALLMRIRPEELVLLLPGLLAMPLYPLFYALDPRAVPLSQPSDEANAASRGLQLVGLMIISFGLSALGAWAHAGGWLWWFLLGEALVIALLYLGLRPRLRAVKWAHEE